jgi:endonuclease/exonuclease/phosphatase (EEP) superfamily protein YafD
VAHDPELSAAPIPTPDVRQSRHRLLPSFLSFTTLVTGALAALVATSDYAAVPLLVADIAPIVALASIAVLVGAVLRVRPVWVAAIALTAASITAVRIVPDLAAALFVSSERQPDRGDALKLVTANLWSQNYSGKRFLEFVAREQPDILVLQEGYGIWKYYLDQLYPEYRIGAGCALPHECNVVIASRFPFASQAEAGSTCCVLATVTLPSRLGGGTINVVGLHLSRTLDRTERESEIASALQLVATPGPRDILAGDLNALPWSTTIRQLDRYSGLERVTRFTPSWPTPQNFFPVMPIDHIYAGCGWRTTSLRRGPDIGSDHYPIVTTLALASCADGP